MALATAFVQGHEYQLELDENRGRQNMAKELLLRIHSCEVLHGDVRAENLLVDDRSDKVWWIDFGMATPSKDENLFRLELEEVEKLGDLGTSPSHPMN